MYRATEIARFYESLPEETKGSFDKLAGIAAVEALFSARDKRDKPFTTMKRGELLAILAPEAFDSVDRFNELLDEGEDIPEKVQGADIVALSQQFLLLPSETQFLVLFRIAGMLNLSALSMFSQTQQTEGHA